MKNLIFTLLIFFANYLQAQNHDNWWVFGYDYNNLNDTSSIFGGAFIDFSSQQPVITKKTIPINIGLCAGICSDSFGNLLYYSNGIRIINKNNQLMENGDTINPGSFWNSTNQTGYSNPIGPLSFPNPCYPDQYYFIHLAGKIENGDLVLAPLYYSLIDMQLNNGLGKVVEKNKVLLEGNVIWPALVKHANGRDWWLLAGQIGSPVFSRFLISPQGITGPMEQTTPIVFPNTDGSSTCLFSSDGTWYARSDAFGGIHLFSFNRCTGELSNHQYLPHVVDYFITGGLAFSPDSKKLYNLRPDHIIQFDLSEGTLDYSTMDTVQLYDWFYEPFPPFSTAYFFAQLGSDDKLYIACPSTTPNIHVLHHPNLPVPLTDLENRGLPLPRINGRTVCYFPNYRLGVWEGSPCDTLLVQNPAPGFVNTSYEAFLEREAHFTLRQPKVPEGKGNSNAPKPVENDPMDVRVQVLQTLKRNETHEKN